MAINNSPLKNMTEEEKLAYFSDGNLLPNVDPFNWVNYGNQDSLENSNWNAFNQNNQPVFNQNQFDQLLNQDQQYQQKAKKAKNNRIAIENAPVKPFVPSMDYWSKVYGGKGLPQVEVAPNTPELDYSLNFGLTPESTNYEVMQAVQNLPQFQNENDKEKFNAWMATNSSEADDAKNRIDWANVPNPQTVVQGLSGLADSNKTWLNKVFNAAYTNNNQGLPQAAPGYANPNPSGVYANPTS